MRYFRAKHFCAGAAQVSGSPGGLGGIVFARARAAFAHWLDQIATQLATHRPSSRTVNPDQSLGLSRRVRGRRHGRLLDPHEEQTPILALRSSKHSDKQAA